MGLAWATEGDPVSTDKTTAMAKYTEGHHSGLALGILTGIVERMDYIVCVV